MKLVSVVGARPQFIKLAAVSRAFAALRAAGQPIEDRIVHTGQHYDHGMSEVFFREMEIPAPHVNLGVHAERHGEMTARMLTGIEQVLVDKRPDALIVYGDTNSTLAGALAAAKLDVPIAHVEAGLRSFNRRMPEEINRVVADHLSAWLLCPTDQAVANLRHEGIPQERLLQVGDVMLDAALHYGARPDVAAGAQELSGRYPEGFDLATVHRAENTDDPARLAAIFEALERIAAQTPVLLPLHPRTRAAAEKAGLALRSVEIVEPVGYLRMLALLKACRVVLTDSGGLQKEAYFFGKPCITLRDETEWTELVEAGCNHVVGASTARIVAAREAAVRSTARRIPGLYGDGEAARRIAELLVGS